MAAAALDDEEEVETQFPEYAKLSTPQHQDKIRVKAAKIVLWKECRRASEATSSEDVALFCGLENTSIKDKNESDSMGI